ncbi:hypothetical protein A6R68_23788, partial [Neotoma lepida]
MAIDVFVLQVGMVKRYGRGDIDHVDLNSSKPVCLTCLLEQHLLLLCPLVQGGVLSLNVSGTEKVKHQASLVESARHVAGIA